MKSMIRMGINKRFFGFPWDSQSCWIDTSLMCMFFPNPMYQILYPMFASNDNPKMKEIKNNLMHIIDDLRHPGDVPTLHGDVRLKVPAGTQNGKMFRLRGQGIKDEAHGYGNGDQHVMVNIEVPAKLSGKEKKALEKVCSSLNKNSFQESIQLQKDKEQFYKRKKKLENDE